MVGPNRRIFEVSLLLVVAAISSSQCFESPHSKPLACEEKFKDAEKFTLNVTSLDVGILNLMNTYTGWGELLDSAPLAISGLTKLIIMSNQKMDFPGVNNTNLMKFPKKFNYPKNFRTSLLEISRQGNLAFLKAHTNMERIRLYNSNVSIHIKDSTRYLISRNEDCIENPLPRSLERIKEVAVKSKELSAEVVKEFKIILELIEEMIKTTKQIELRRQKTQQVVKRNKSLHFTKMFYKEAIKALQSASKDLDKLKNAVTHLMMFYTKMSNFISQATEESEDYARAVRQLNDKEIFEKVQKAIEASFLVHQVADMYVDVSGMYIKDQISNLENMIKYLDLIELKHGELKWSTKSDSEGIRHFIEADEILLREKLVDRHNQIVNEYRWMEDCDSPEDQQFQTQ